MLRITCHRGAVIWGTKSLSLVLWGWFIFGPLFTTPLLSTEGVVVFSSAYKMETTARPLLCLPHVTVLTNWAGRHHNLTSLLSPSLCLSFSVSESFLILFSFVFFSFITFTVHKGGRIFFFFVCLLTVKLNWKEKFFDRWGIKGDMIQTEPTFKKQVGVKSKVWLVNIIHFVWGTLFTAAKSSQFPFCFIYFYFSSLLSSDFNIFLPKMISTNCWRQAILAHNPKMNQNKTRAASKPANSYSKVEINRSSTIYICRKPSSENLFILICLALSEYKINAFDRERGKVFFFLLYPLLSPLSFLFTFKNMHRVPDHIKAQPCCLLLLCQTNFDSKKQNHCRW